MFKADKSLRRYASNIERALSTWEVSPEEWADYIAFLARLLKAIQAHPKEVPLLPHSSSISTRLAQCLNPALPAGVHQKALEVYSYVFDTFGDEFIAAHLHEFLPGLAPVLSFASLSVRPLVYDLFQEHVIQLSAIHLRPALRSIILSLLPALEEGQGEDFDRAFAILRTLEGCFAPKQEDAVSGKDLDGYFWQCLFLAAVTSPSRRQGALKYLTRQLPIFPVRSDKSAADAKSRLSREAECIISPEPGLLVRCFICGLSDGQMLVQRDFLDLMVTNLPLDSSVLQEKIASDDLDRLVFAALQVILRRDMSLNRRLWSWFLGPEPKESNETSQPSSPQLMRKTSGEPNDTQQLEYFTSNGKASLERCILKMLQTPGLDVTHKSRPFRICLALMDRWEIGGPLIPKIFLPAMRSLHEYSLQAESKNVSEVVRSANGFFDGVEASLIWESLLEILREALERDHAATRNLELFNWIIDTFNVRDEEMITVHIPYSIVYMACQMSVASLSHPLRLSLVKTTTKLLELVPSRVLQRTNSPSSTQVWRLDNSSGLSNSEVQRRITDFYKNVHRTSTDKLPIERDATVQVLLSRSLSLLANALGAVEMDIYTSGVAMLTQLLSKIDVAEHLHDPILRNALMHTFGSVQMPENSVPFPLLTTTVSLLSSLASFQATGLMSQTDMIQIEPALTAGVWHHMSPDRPKYHVEAVKAFWQLEALLVASDAFTASVTALTQCAKGTAPKVAAEKAETVRRFAVLWAHSVSPATANTRRGSSISVLTDADQQRRARNILEQPLMVVLDMLAFPNDSAFSVVKSWLAQLPSLEQVLQPIMTRVFDIDLATEQTSEPAERVRLRWHDSRIREIVYYFGHVRNLLAHGSTWTWQCILKTTVPNSTGHDENGLVVLANTCMRLLFSMHHTSAQLNQQITSVLELLLSSPQAMELRTLDLDSRLLDAIEVCMNGDMHAMQGDLLNLVHIALKIRLACAHPEEPAEHTMIVPVSTKRPSRATASHSDSSSVSHRTMISPPPQLFRCLRMGFANPRARYHLDKWLALLADILPTFAEAIIANLLPLVETFLGELTKCFQRLTTLSSATATNTTTAPEAVIMSLFEGLEMLLDRAYDCLLQETATEPTPKEPDTRPSFLSNVTSGVFKSEGPPSRSVTANSRLTVLLAFHDSIRVAMRMWLWASNTADVADLDQTCTATIAYNALKVRNKTRHVLQQLFSLELLEGLEVVISYWCSAANNVEAASALSLLHVMQVSRPKSVVPATLDALCTRTNPSAISSARHSSLTIDLKPAEIAIFLSSYLDSTEDDAMDEIWPDCLSFLRDVLANPLPHRQVLPHLLSIILLLAEKLNNTNFGEQRKMRRDLGDLFQRLLTATFTTLPSGYVTEPVRETLANGKQETRPASLERSMLLIPVLNRITAKLDLILDAPERMTAAINNISQSLVSPMFHAKSYPRNITSDLLELIINMSRKVPASKAWKKEVADGFNDPRTLACTPALMKDSWFQVLHQWTLHEKERMSELLSRLAAPSSAGIMFGVGASAARLEADRKTQLNLRRICLLLLASPEDTYVAHVRTIEEKMSELFDASPASSPSSTIKAELFMLCRALALSVSTVQLAPLWPIINDKLQAALHSLLPNAANSEEFNNLTLLQACKLLDLLITLSPDDFQLHQWLYISDTIDAVYHPEDWSPTALVDQIAEVLGGSSNIDDSHLVLGPGSGSNHRRPLLLSDAVDKEDVKAMPKEDFVRAVLRPFLSQLSIHTYEGTYSMDMPSMEELRANLLEDVLDLGSVVE